LQPAAQYIDAALAPRAGPAAAKLAGPHRPGRGTSLSGAARAPGARLRTPIASHAALTLDVRDAVVLGACPERGKGAAGGGGGGGVGDGDVRGPRRPREPLSRRATSSLSLARRRSAMPALVHAKPATTTSGESHTGTRAAVWGRSPRRTRLPSRMRVPSPSWAAALAPNRTVQSTPVSRMLCARPRRCRMERVRNASSMSSIRPSLTCTWSYPVGDRGTTGAPAGRRCAGEPLASAPAHHPARPPRVVRRGTTPAHRSAEGYLAAARPGCGRGEKDERGELGSGPPTNGTLRSPNPARRRPWT
jgi:hypothetical protein